MRFINRKTHAVMDYVMGVLLIASPWILGFSDNATARWSAEAIGILMLFVSLVTNYEGGLVKALPMGAHLSMDVIAGIFLAVSPWLLGFNNDVYIPHLILGILEIGAAICTQPGSKHATSGTAARPDFWYR
jgi:hypothetical protein